MSDIAPEYRWIASESFVSDERAIYSARVDPDFDELPTRSERIGDSVITYRVGGKRKRISESVRRDVWERDEGTCVYCRFEANEIDHIVPWAFGGMDVFDNLVACCTICNQLVSDKIFDTFAEKRDYIRAKYGPYLAKRLRMVRRKLSICGDCQMVFEPRIKGASGILCGSCYKRDEERYTRGKADKQEQKMLINSGVIVSTTSRGRKRF